MFLDSGGMTKFIFGKDTTVQSYTDIHCAKMLMPLYIMLLSY